MAIYTMSNQAFVASSLYDCFIAFATISRMVRKLIKAETIGILSKVFGQKTGRGLKPNVRSSLLVYISRMIVISYIVDSAVVSKRVG